MHVYDDEPKYYLAYQNRPWVKSLHQSGRQDIVINLLTEESDTAKRQFGAALEHLKIQATVTNLLNFPVSTPVNEKHYWCVLTRFDAFSVTLGDSWFQIHANRVTRESQPGAHAAIVNTVGKELGVIKSSESVEVNEADGPIVDIGAEDVADAD